MLTQEQIFKIKWLIALNENNRDKRGSLAYQKPKSDQIFDIHARVQGVGLGLRAYNDPKLLEWLKTMDTNLFAINQNDCDLDVSLLPDIGIDYSEFEHEPLSNTVHTTLEFINNHRKKRPVVFENEFWYHREIVTDHINDISQLKKGDVLIRSLPFFEDFTKGNNFDELMSHCTEHDIPVLLDLIWMPLTNEVIKVKEYDCVEVLCHSFTKTLPIAGIKGGFVSWRKPITKAKKLYPLGSKIGLHIAQQYMEQFGYYYVRDSLKLMQRKWCDVLGLGMNNFVYAGVIPKGHVLETENLHSKMVPNGKIKLFNLVPYYENNDAISDFLGIDR